MSREAYRAAVLVCILLAVGVVCGLLGYVLAARVVLGFVLVIAVLSLLALVSDLLGWP